MTGKKETAAVPPSPLFLSPSHPFPLSSASLYPSLPPKLMQNWDLSCGQKAIRMYRGDVSRGKNHKILMLHFVTTSPLYTPLIWRQITNGNLHLLEIYFPLSLL